MSRVHELTARVNSLEEQLGLDSNSSKESPVESLRREITTLKGRCTKLENRVKKLEE